MYISDIQIAPYKGQLWSAPCYSEKPDYATHEAVANRKQVLNTIIADLTYSIHLDATLLDGVKSVLCYINDTFEHCVLTENVLYFTAGKYIFLDYYGFVALSFCINYEDHTQKWLYSEYLPVLVRRGTYEISVRSMAEFVYAHQSELLYQGPAKATNGADLEEYSRKSMEAHLILMTELIATYEQLFPYFNTNARFETQPTNTVDRAEKLRYMTQGTLQYMAQHPEELRRANGTSGVRIGRKTYHPEHTLIVQSQKSYNIYENRVIVGYLRVVIQKLQQLEADTVNLIASVHASVEDYGEYVYSPAYLFEPTVKALEHAQKAYHDGILRLQRLYMMYKNALSLKDSDFKATEVHQDNVPRPSAIFSAVPQYHMLYTCIYRWVNFGGYSLAGEQYMLSFMKVSTLYENFIATKFLLYLKNKGWIPESKFPHKYEATSKNWMYHNTSCANTFHFTKQDADITLYLQPVIYCNTPEDTNGIGLYRNTTWSLEKDSETYDKSKRKKDGILRGNYYTPDFLIKYHDSTGSRYLIGDGKFSALDSVVSHQMAELTYKYLFSISPQSPTDKYMGMCIIYGKCFDGDMLRSAYDVKKDSRPIIPYAHFIPLTAGVQEEKHTSYFDELLTMLQ